MGKQRCDLFQSSEHPIEVQTRLRLADALDKIALILQPSRPESLFAVLIVIPMLVRSCVELAW